MEAALTRRPLWAHALAATALGLGLHLAAALATDLAPDESYYAAWSRHLGWRYLDHPPAVAWVVAAGRALAGEGALGVRLPALVAGALLPLLLAFAAGRLAGHRAQRPEEAWTQRPEEVRAQRPSPRATAPFDPQAAVRALWLTSATLLVHVLGVVTTPDTPLVLAWAAALAVAADLWARPASPSGRLVLLGALSGLAVLSKLTGWALPAGLLAALLWTPRLRRATGARLVLVPAAALAVAWPWLAGTLGAPDGSDLAFQWSRVSLRGVPGRYVPELLAGQLGLLGPVVGLLAVGWGAAALRRREETDRLLLALSAPLLAAFLALAFLRPVEANWPGPAWMAPLVGLAVFGFAPRWRPWLLWSAAPLVLALHLVAMTGLPFLPKDPTARVRGWARLGARLAPICRSAPDDGAARLAVPGYALQGAILQHAPECAPVRAVPTDRPTQFERWPAPPLGPATLLVEEAGRRRWAPPGCEAGEPVRTVATPERTLVLRRLRCP